jgi:ABC-type multidrug transport system ATPase subunit
MPPILIAQSISKRFGATPLFDNISCAVHDGDRIGLIGPNGAGKSTLLAILGAEQQPDSGEVSFRKGVRIGYVHQISEFAPATQFGKSLRPHLNAQPFQPSRTSSGCAKHWAEPALPKATHPAVALPVIQAWTVKPRA